MSGPSPASTSAEASAGPSDPPASAPTTSSSSSPSAHPERLALPPIPTEEERRILDVTEGNKVALDELGPMIINSDGTVSRISNWAGMSQIERDRTVRLLVRKRNVERLHKLKESGEAAASAGADSQPTAS